MHIAVDNRENWNLSIAERFWTEIAPPHHLVQIYHCEENFLSTLTSFITTGFLADEAVIVIATKQHLDRVSEQLYSKGFDPAGLVEKGQYIPVDARELLIKFLFGTSIDETFFKNTISGLVSEAQKYNSKFRAFGETVALLWEQRMHLATVHLERLWNELHNQSPFTLFCAYPASGFSSAQRLSLRMICDHHAKIIDGEPGDPFYIRYKKTEFCRTP